MAEAPENQKARFNVFYLVSLLASISPLFLALMLIFGLLSAVMNMALIGYISSLLDGSRSPKEHGATAFILLCLTATICHVLSQGFSNSLSQKVILNLRVGLCNRIVTTPLADLERIGRPQLLTFLTNDIPILANALVVIPGITINVFILLGAAVYLFILSPELMLGTFTFFIAGLLIYVYITRQASNFFQLTRTEYGNLHKHFRSLLEGIKELKIYRHWKNTFMSDHIYFSHKRFHNFEFRARFIYELAGNVGSLLFFILIGSLIFFAPENLNIPSSVLLGYTLTILYCMTPITGVMTAYPSIRHGWVAHDRLSRIGGALRVEPQVVRHEATFEPPTWKRLDLSNVSYAYTDRLGAVETTIGPVSLTLNPGEIVFIIGGNGAGKTTIGKILTGLYTPTAGAIHLDDKMICDESRDEYRQMFAAVFSDFYLFDSVLNKGKPSFDGPAFELLCKLKLSDKVTVSEGVFSTLDLSSGEKKRLALLVAYLEDKPIYVLDEWAADQDPVFKKFFYEHLITELKMRQKCVVVITHDDRYFQLADRIVQIDNAPKSYE